MPAITPFLWFDNQAAEAAAFYVSVFPNSRVLTTTHYGESGPGVPGSVMTVEFELDGKKFVALNGGPSQSSFDESVSFVVECSSQEEVDHYWEHLLLHGGEEIACGWLKDRYGLRWQVTPTELMELIGDPDPVTAERAMRSMMTMKKIDLPTLRAAVAG